MPLMRYLLFFAVAAAIIGSSHAYLALRFGAAAPASWRPWIGAAAASNALLLVGTLFASRRLPDGALSTALATVGYTLMGLFTLVFASMLAVELGRGVAWLVDAVGGLFGVSPVAGTLPDPGRRQALLGAVNVGALSLSAGVGAAAFVRNRRPVAVVRGLEKVGRVWVYVSCGTGYWGPPMRLGAPAEITAITLRRSPRLT